MKRLCPQHGIDPVETEKAFPGSPSKAETWCPSWPGGHAITEWHVVSASGEVLEVGTQEAPIVRTTVGKNYKPGAPKVHPWRSRRIA